MERRRPTALTAGCTTQFGNTLKGQNPLTIRPLSVKTMRRKAMTNTVKDNLPLGKQHFRSLACAAGASFGRSFLRDATTNREPPQPVGKLLIGDDEYWYQD